METNTSIEKIIKDIIVNRNLKYSDVSINTGINLSLLMDCLVEKRSFSASEFLVICNYLKLNLRDFEDMNAN